jgi:hypothetical protein
MLASQRPPAVHDHVVHGTLAHDIFASRKFEDGQGFTLDGGTQGDLN